MEANPSPEVDSILKFTADLTIALSNEPLGVANKLLSKRLISSEVYSKVLISTYSANEKAAIMIESARKVVEITPSKFTEFLGILSELTCAQEIVESLHSTYQRESASQILQGSHQFSTPSITYQSELTTVTIFHVTLGRHTQVVIILCMSVYYHEICCMQQGVIGFFMVFLSCTCTCTVDFAKEDLLRISLT